MTDTEKLLKAIAITEVAVQNMAELAITPTQRAIGLAFHMQRQCELAMPDSATALAFKTAIATT